MISWMNRLADAHFRKELGGRLVFIPFTSRGKCYFVDSKADEEKVRAFVNMYRIPNALISLLMSPMVMVPGLILEDYGGLTPRAHRLTIALGVSGSQQRGLRRVALVCLVAGLILLGLALVALTGHSR